METRVEIRVYDLSRGMAKWASPLLAGQRLEGIWHTEIAVYGKQLSYGPHCGIEDSKARKAWQLRPRHLLEASLISGFLGSLNMGYTTVSRERFEKWLKEKKTKYQDSKYHPLDFNCNTFTEECVEFLTGREMPHWLLEQPQLLAMTPRGELIRSLLMICYLPPARLGFRLLRMYLSHCTMMAVVPALAGMLPAALVTSTGFAGVLRVARAVEEVETPPPIPFLGGWD